MKFYVELLKLLFNKVILKKDNGTVIKKFCEKMGIVYIKFAQILATQNYGNIFTENDRKMLSSICDDCNPISFEEIEVFLKEEYGENLNNVFSYIDVNPIGSASISQVHKAILKNGEEVAIKVKRKDITDNIDKEVKRLKSIVHRFGKFVKFGNYIGGDQALDLYLKWIREETDFLNEIKNIKTYSDFSSSVNNKVEGNKLIKIPKIYDELCTDKIIVMEYINHNTINKLELDEENNDKIRTALNSYISSSFYAMFNNKKIVFHGDPHGGNIYIDEQGNIGFLDMGLLFELSDEDAKLTKDFFFAAYTRNYEKMYNLVIPYGKMDENIKIKFKEDIKKYCNKLASKPVTSYFIDMMNICLKYEVCPPNFLFCMAKTFMCLGGINNFSKNEMAGTELLKEQVIEFCIRKSLEETKNIVISSIKIAPKFLKNTCRYGLVKGIAKEVSKHEEFYHQTKQLLENYKEILEMIQPIDNNEEKAQCTKTL